MRRAAVDFLSAASACCGTVVSSISLTLCDCSYMDFQVETLIQQQTQWPETNRCRKPPPPFSSIFLPMKSLFRSAIDSIQIDSDLGAFVSSLTAVSVLKSEQQPVESP